MIPSILSIATATPSYIYDQKKSAEKFIDIFELDKEKSERLALLYNNSAIDKRHSVTDDFNHARKKWDFWGENFPKISPGTAARNEKYKKEAPRLALEAAKKAIHNWDGDPSEITHVISVSCTGLIAPGIEFDLMRFLKLKASTYRLGINFMGCFGAFKGLSTAKAFAQENPSHRILVVCTELCSLHFQTDLDNDNLLGGSLFADGSAAVIVGMTSQEDKKSLWNIVEHHSHGLDNTLDLMGWEIGDTGFLMRLSHKVPVYIGRNIKNFIHEFLPLEIPIQDCDWPIHPGGKSILQAVEKSLCLEKSQTLSSWKTLANYGNMSSATFLFVLEDLLKQKERKKWAVGVAFGPGLSMEGILLKTAGFP